MSPEQLEHGKLSIEETQAFAATLHEATERLASPHIRATQEQELRPLAYALACELIFFGDDAAFKEEI